MTPIDQFCTIIQMSFRKTNYKHSVSDTLQQLNTISKLNCCLKEPPLPIIELYKLFVIIIPINDTKAIL